MVAKLKHVVDGKWQCSKEGDCCDLFAEFTLGSKCSMLREDRSCECYSTRPKICRIDSFNIEGLDRNEYLIARCDLIHKLREWRDEVGENKSTKWILKKIVESGIR